MSEVAIFVIAVVVAWVGGALSVWLTRDDARVTRVVREMGYLTACIEDLATVIEDATAKTEALTKQLQPEAFVAQRPPVVEGDAGEVSS